LPEDWNADFKLLCRGNFLVTASFGNGLVSSVGILSQCGSDCRIINPWVGKKVTLYRNNKKAETKSGKLLIFSTEIKEQIKLIKVN
jgi:hypothetical protein